MSEEEKAIETLKHFRDYYVREDIHRESFISDESYEKALKEERKLRQNFDTALNLINKLQKENEKYKYLYQKALDNTIKSDKENIDLKKQIDLMADSFAEEGFYNEHCQTLMDNELCPNDCNKCVKQYFEKLAKENK